MKCPAVSVWCAVWYTAPRRDSNRRDPCRKLGGRALRTPGYFGLTRAMAALLDTPAYRAWYKVAREMVDTQGPTVDLATLVVEGVTRDDYFRADSAKNYFR